MPDLKISQLSSAAPTTAAQIPANINSTTVRFTLQEALAQPTTATGDILYRNSSGEMVRLAVGASGAVAYISSAGLPAWLAAGTTGQFLRVGASAGELGWAAVAQVPSTAGVSSGALIHISSVGTPAWLAAGTTGQFLKVGASAGELAWGPVSGGGSTNVWKFGIVSSQVISSVGSWQAINWTVELMDADGTHSTAANSSLITLPTSGNWLLGLTLAGTLSSGASNKGARIMEGTTMVGMYAVPFSNGTDLRLVVTSFHNFASSGIAITAAAYADAVPWKVGDVGYSSECLFWGHRLS